MIVPMYQVSITGLRDDFLHIAKILYDNQVFQPSKFKHSLILDLENIRLHSSFEEIVKLQNELISLKSSLENLSINTLNINPEFKEEISRYSPLFSEKSVPTTEKQFKEYVIEKIKEISQDSQKYQKRIKEINGILKIYSLYKNYLLNFNPLLNQLSKNTFPQYTIFVLERSKVPIEQLMADIKEKSKEPVDLYLNTLDEKFLVLIVFTFNVSVVNSVIEYYNKLISNANVENNNQSSPKKRIINIDLKQMEQLEKEALELHKKLDKIAQRSKPIIYGLIQIIDDKLALTKLVDNIKLTKYTFMIIGYVPETKINFFSEDLVILLNGRVSISINKVHSTDENTPILRKLPKIVRPFQLFSDLLGKPKYGSYDAVFMIAIFWPLYWGFMVGDVGYALISIFLALLIRKKTQNENLKQLSLILIYAGIVTAIFGILYGEFFGDLPLRLFKVNNITFYPLFDRLDSIIDYLEITLIFAYFIIVLSVSLGLINGILLRNSQMIKMSISTLAMVIATGLSVIDVAFLHLNLLFLLIITIIISIIGMIRFEGIKGIIQPLEILTNILSFSRLMAIGLVGVIIARIANIFIFDGTLGPIGILLGLALHALNFVIILISPSIQALRLNMYEFMSHFYQSGGVEYRPFGYKGMKTLNEQ